MKSPKSSQIKSVFVICLLTSLTSLTTSKALEIPVGPDVDRDTGVAIPNKEVGYNPLNLSKSIVGTADGELKWVGTGEKITYAITFRNKDDSTLNKVSIVDTLPKEVSFVRARADDPGVFGRYDAKAHTYTWSYTSLPPAKSPTLLEIVVQVNQDAPPATIISNSVTIDSDETQPTAAGVDAITYYKDLNLSKIVAGSVIGETEYVDGNDLVTYSICFDNDNNAPVTNVSIVDTLPKYVTFIAADGDGTFGEYDPKLHVYKWSYPSLPPGSSTCLELTARVKEGTAPATTITNLVTIDGDETLPSTASVDVVVGESPFEVADFRILPEIIRRTGDSNEIRAIATFPKGIGKDDIKDTLPTLYPGRIRAKRQIVEGTANEAVVTAVFDRAELLNAIPNGQVNLKVVGKLKAGRSWYGEASVSISGAGGPNGGVWDYVSSIDIAQIWDYNDPTDSTDLTYDFQLRISALGYMAVDMDTDVVSVEFLTPAGNTFQIPRGPGQWSNRIWTSYKYEYDTEWGEATWEYRSRSTNLADLQAYGDGEYTIILHYADGNQSQTTAWFAVPDTHDRIPQPTQEPVLTSPVHHQTLGSPVTFTWEPCTDPNADYIHIDVDELGTAGLGDKGTDFDKTETKWSRVYLPDGVWETEIVFDQWMSNMTNRDGIPVSLRKSSQSKYRFIAAGSPWTKYEVWGGKTFIDSSKGSYGDVADLKTNGYVKLGESNGPTATFSGQYQYYFIGTVGKFLLDSIQGSDGSYYSSFEANMERSNISEPNNLLGPPDGNCALVGESNWNDYSGYFAFTNPGNWTGLTIITSEVNLTLSKSIISVAGETENISPNDSITYRIFVDSNDLAHDVTDLTVVDILPEEVRFVSADSNEVPGFYDPVAHTYTWLYPSLAPDSTVEMPLTVQVNPDVPLGTTVTNYVTVTTNETPPTTAAADAIVRVQPLQVQSMRMVPNIITRSGESYDVQAIAIFPPGIGKGDINDVLLPTLYPGSIKAKRQIVYGTGTRAKVIALFDKAELVNAISDDGEITVKVVGELKTGRSWYGKDTICITR